MSHAPDAPYERGYVLGSRVVGSGHRRTCLRRTASVAVAVTVCTGCPESSDEGGVDETDPFEAAFEAGTDVGAFLSVWGPASDDVYAVGGQVQDLADPGIAAMMHRDAEGWSEVSLPDDVPQLNWIHGSGDTVWAVGNAGIALRQTDAGWERVETPVDVPLWGVFVFSDADVWAVGGNAFEEGSAVIVHGSSGNWQSVDLPDIDRSTAALFKVWGASPDDVWAVGDSGVVLHYDGSAWSQTPSSTTRDLISLWGTGPDDIVAVGGRDIATIARFDGTTWSSENIGMLPGLNGVWMSDNGSAVTVGAMGRAAVIPAESFDFEPVETKAGINVLHAVYGFEDGTRYAVGGTLDRSPPLSGTIIERIAF